MLVTKNNVFVVSMCGMVFFAFLFFLSTGACYDRVWCQILQDTFSNENLTVAFLFPPLFLFSLITYKMREKVFRAWLHFAYWWVPLSIVLTFLSRGGGGFGMPNVFDQEFVAFVFSALFFIVSLLIIAWKYIATRRSAA
ncbi:MAG: hypothetical protein AAB947_00735 [Patescibacteria group bacterium]